MKAFLLAEPGVLQSGLLPFIRSFPFIELVDVASDIQELAHTFLPDDLRLVILAFSPSQSAGCETIQWIKQNCPHAVCIVLAENLRRRDAAIAAGADRVLLKGFSALEFSRAVLGASIK